MRRKFACLLCLVCASLLAKADQTKVLYPFDYCLVSGEKFGGSLGEPVSVDYKDHEVKFCCKGCLKTFYANPEFFLRQIDRAADGRFQ
ncbi:MAG: hypothetical protein C5B47_08705 [Verrucomicrobia bacterium]|nr:MAG: hypothetical protein C5B47_08705 [Verrucomicrobiota bacterium]